MLAAVFPNQVIYSKEHQEHRTSYSFAVVFMSNFDGQIRIEVCDLCGYEDVSCLHIHNTIDSRRVKLTCRLCGG